MYRRLIPLAFAAAIAACGPDAAGPPTSELALAQEAQLIAQHAAATTGATHDGWLHRLLDTLRTTDDPEARAFLEQARAYRDSARTARESGNYEELMAKNGEGLTKTYNRFHDPDEISPDIQQLRELHAVMDRAVLEAYGLNDIAEQAHSQFLLDYEDDESEEDVRARRRRKKGWCPPSIAILSAITAMAPGRRLG